MNHSSPQPTPQTLPRHLAVIMDGNGRWAQAQGLPRIAGHRQGAKTVDMVTMECARLGIEALTLYSFSSENWKRPAEEVDFLMALCKEHLVEQRSRMVDNDIRFRRIGRRAGLPDEVLEESDACEEATRDCGGMTLSLALNYGSRAELADVARSMAEDAAAGRLDPRDIDESMVTTRLDTAGLPDPDLLLRTAGEMRISNFLLWQISYAELVVTDVLWPAFEISDLHQAFTDFSGRTRRFGLIDPSPGSETAAKGP
ncbi:MAG: di-trans,poly-cis-decaprenylcistransferase [Phycisphaera sp. TMED9]|nr:MAG: di-trans,poly-cis-decaprenylcistransferase [Phycisphaera sp. TMED9]